MTLQKSPHKNINTKRLAWVTALLCIGCCSIPIVLGLGLGFSALAGLTVYFESAALGMLMVTLGVFVYMKYKQRKESPAASCEVDCGCKNDSETP